MVLEKKANEWWDMCVEINYFNTETKLNTFKMTIAKMIECVQIFGGFRKGTFILIAMGFCTFYEYEAPFLCVFQFGA